MEALDTARVAEIVVTGNSGAAYGSGYRIATALVLTVDHILGDASDPGTCTVRLGGGDTPLTATPVWRGTDGRDLALLRLDHPPDTVLPVSFGALPRGMGSVPFIGVGFPAFRTRPEEPGVQGLRRRSSQQVDGFVRLGSSMKTRLLDLAYLTTAPLLPGPRDPDPWLGLSGTALFTRDSGLLVGVQAHRLPAAGISSAEAEPLTDALGDSAFCRQLALGGVRNETRPVALGDEPPEPEPLLRAVVPQHELISGFGDFKKNLTSEQLSFVSPGPDHPAEPGNLFVRLVGAGDRGVLLVGAAGTGKTRAGIEVGRLALDAGWRVLHVLPGEDNSVTEEIAEQVCADPAPVLVVVDYLNESQLDLPTLRHRVIPRARRHNISVALLASVRPGWLRKANRAQLHELFDEVELRQDDDFQKQVVDNALLSLAPAATERLGIAHMREICGHRPIVALLVAREVERRFTSGLSLPAPTGLREGGEIPRWLKSRLGEDDLSVPGRAHAFVPVHASPSLVAAAAATAACPQAREDVTAAARAALAGMRGTAGTAGPTGTAVAESGTGPQHRASRAENLAPRAEDVVPRAEDVVPRAEDVVSTLLSLGWLETGDDGTLSVAHDLVTDQLVESVLLPERDEAPDTAGAHALLAGCLVSPRAVGRAALNIGRLVNDLALFDRSGPVSAVLNSWFTQNAATLGAVLRLDANVGSYALGAVCTGAPWSASAVQCWSQVVGPWLADFGSRVAARHLLYRGLHHLPEDGARLLLPTVWSWLTRHGDVGQASFVLGPLLSRGDLGQDIAEKASTAALTWLTTHATDREAEYVLRPLLSRTDLGTTASEKAAVAALDWLDAHSATQETQFVLGPLLARPDLGPASAGRTVARALTWLTVHPVATEAPFVLGPLLARADLDADASGTAVEAALTWIAAHAGVQEAQFVLRPLLSRTDLTTDTADRSVTAALDWLDAHNAHQGAEYVYRPLLSRTDLGTDEAGKAVTAALAWLDTHATGQEAQFVLGPLLSRTDLGTTAAEEAIGAALVWLGTHATGAEAQFVLGPLLRQLPLRETPPVVMEMVDEWVRLHLPQEDFTFLSKWILRQRLMNPLIYRALLDWAHANPDSEDLVHRMARTSFLVGPYIETWEEGRAWLRAVELCLDQAERLGAQSNTSGVLDALVCRLPQQFRVGIGAAWADDCIRRWLALPFAMDPQVFHPNSEIINRCHALLVGGGLDAGTAATVAARLRDWVATWPAEARNAEALAYIETHMLTAGATG
ncbi:hypothetical protein ACGFZH_09890 [Streptomyces zaomyceticus]|uniref:hypothetical protein n=1 Tax=Streptomyces zaomyceticus TaxID=68286 RepID=UPI003713D396